MGRVPGRVVLAGGQDVKEMDEMVLWAPEEEEGTGISESSEEEARPSKMFSFPSFPLFLYSERTRGCFFFLLFGGIWGKGEQGYLTITAQAGPR